MNLHSFALTKYGNHLGMEPSRRLQRIGIDKVHLRPDRHISGGRGGEPIAPEVFRTLHGQFFQKSRQPEQEVLNSFFFFS
jgi:hypothetical protein